MIVEFYKCDACAKTEEIASGVSSAGDWIVIESQNISMPSKFVLMHKGFQTVRASVHCCSLKCFEEYLAKFPVDMQIKV